MAPLYFDLGKPYEFTLHSGRKVLIAVHGQAAGSDSFEISVDGVRGVYSDLNKALGEPFTSVKSAG